MERPKVVLLIFVSGKIVITGAKVMLVRGQCCDFSFSPDGVVVWLSFVGQNRESMIEAFDKIYPVLVKYKKKTPALVVV